MFIVEKGLSNLYDFLGTTELLIMSCTSIGQPIDDGEEDNTTATSCTKDTDGKRRVQKWTTGVWFCVSGGGYGNHSTSIRAWCMCTHEMYIAIYALDEKNHLNAFGAYNVTFMVCFLM